MKFDMKRVRGFTATICAVLTTLAFAPALLHGDESPQTNPTTAPGETPRAALKAYNAAMRAGDVDGIVALQHAANPTEARVARVIAKAEVEVARLLAAARAKFGADGAVAVGRAIGDVSDADIDESSETITGDRAVLRFPFGGAAPMIRADGEWKASVAETIRASGAGPGPGTAQEAMDRFTRRGSFARALADEIAAGKVKSPDDAVARIEHHLRGTGDDDPAN
jgi:hypothetical protein